MKVRVSGNVNHDVLPFNENMDLASEESKSPKNIPMALTASFAFSNLLVRGIRKTKNFLHRVPHPSTPDFFGLVFVLRQGIWYGRLPLYVSKQTLNL